MLAIDEFDSVNIGLKVGKFISKSGDIDVEKIDAESKENRFDIVTVISQGTRLNLKHLYEAGFKFLGSKAIYVTKEFNPKEGKQCDLSNIFFSSFTPPNDQLNDYKEDLHRLGQIVGEKSRYFFDTDHPEAWKTVYHTWIDNLLNGRSDNMILAIDAATGCAVGFISLIEKEDTLLIDLVAVDPNHANHGIGSALTRQALQIAHEKNMKKVEVVTESDNIPAQRVYQKAGFIINDSVNIFYKKY